MQNILAIILVIAGVIAITSNFASVPWYTTNQVSNNVLLGTLYLIWSGILISRS